MRRVVLAAVVLATVLGAVGGCGGSSEPETKKTGGRQWRPAETAPK